MILGLVLNKNTVDNNSVVHFTAKSYQNLSMKLGV